MKGYRRATEYQGGAASSSTPVRVETRGYRRAIERQGSASGTSTSANVRPRQEGNVTRLPLRNGRLGIQPLEEEDDENNQLTKRHMAAARFNLNNLLVADVFSANVVSEEITIPTKHQLTTLQQQSANLKGQLDRLNQDIANLQNAHAAKLRHIQEKSEQFDIDYKKVCDEAPPVDQQRMEDLIDKWTEKLRKAYEAYKEKQYEEEAKRAATKQRNPNLSALLE